MNYPDQGEYRDRMREELQPVLNAVLKEAAIRRPPDPIRFVATHIRHLRIDEDLNVVQISRCAVCEKICRPESALPTTVPEEAPNNRYSNNKRNAEVVRSNNPKNPKTANAADDDLVEQLKREPCLQIKHWKSFDVVANGNALYEKFNRKLKWWHLAEALSSVTASAPQIPPNSEREEWYNVIFFISSTFSDMHDERDHIVTEVLQELQQWCDDEALRLRIVPIDFRWGIQSQKAFEVCMRQLDACKAQNGMAYFICLVADRYGWRPERLTDIAEDLRREFCYIPGMSVTAMEIFTGALWDKNPNALFFIRDSKVIDQVRTFASVQQSEAIYRAYRTPEGEDSVSLHKVNEAIRATLPSQVLDYSCNVEPRLETYGKEGKLKLNKFVCADGRTIREAILDFYKSKLQKQYPRVDNGKRKSPFDEERRLHRDFMTQNAIVLFGRQKQVAAIRQYIDSDTSKDIAFVSGPAGVGKTALLARIASAYSSSNRTKLFVHFVGIAPGSTSLDRLLRRVWYECLGRVESRIPKSVSELVVGLGPNYAEVNSNASKFDRVLIIIDALNQLDSPNDVLKLSWLAKQVTGKVRVIVSATTRQQVESECIAPLRTGSILEVAIDLFTQDESKQIVRGFFDRFAKTLNDAQLQTICAKTDAGLSLWITLACEELRIYGRFPTFNEKVNSLAGDLPSLILQMLRNSMDRAEENTYLLQAAFCLVCASKSGMTEDDLRKLLGAEPTIPENDEDSTFKQTDRDLSKESWALISLELRKYLRPVRAATGTLDFYHRVVGDTIRKYLFPDEASKRKWHKRLARYFESNPSDLGLKSSALIHQLTQLNDVKKLRDFLLQYSVFKELSQVQNLPELLQSWSKVTIGRYALIIRDYQAALVELWPKELQLQPKQDASGFVKLWAVRVSSAPNDDKSVVNLLGSPTVFPLFGDFSDRTWCPRAHANANARSRRGEQERSGAFIELEYDAAIRVSAVRIFETYNAGAVSLVALQDEQSKWQSVYSSTQTQVLKRSRALQVKFNVPFLSNRVRIELQPSTRDPIQIDAVAIEGYLRNAPPFRNDSATSVGQSALNRQFASNVISCSSLDGDPKKVCGPPVYYPNFTQKDKEALWLPYADSAGARFIELGFEKSVFVAALELFEIYNPGGVTRIAFRNQSGEWHFVYSVRAEKLKGVRRFVPTTERPKWKTNAVRIEIDIGPADDWVLLDAVALFGYEDADASSKNLDGAKQLVEQFYSKQQSTAGGDIDEKDDSLDFDPYARSISPQDLSKWLDAAVLCARFFVDVKQMIAQEWDSSDDIDNVRKLIARFANWCYDLINRIVPTRNEPHLGPLVAACFDELALRVEDAIRLCESNKDNRSLPVLYAKKGSLLYEKPESNLEDVNKWFDKALELAESEIGARDRATGLIHQMFGKVKHNAGVRGRSKRSSPSVLLEQAAHEHLAEVAILESICGADHLLTQRAVKRAMMVLGLTDDDDTLRNLKKRYPAISENEL